MYLLERERERDYVLVQSPNAHNDWGRAKANLGAGNTIQVTHVGDEESS